jgi:cell division protein FtsQ
MAKKETQKTLSGRPIRPQKSERGHARRRGKQEAIHDEEPDVSEEEYFDGEEPDTSEEEYFDGEEADVSEEEYFDGEEPDVSEEECFDDEAGSVGEEQPTSGTTKKKRRKKHLFLNIAIVIAALVLLYLIATSDLFAIKDITVKSSGSHFAESQIVELSGIQKGSNLFKTSTGKAEDRLMAEPYIAKATIARELPGTMSIDVKERKENYIINVDGKYAVIDWSGMVLDSVDSAPNLPIVEGIEIDKAVTGSSIEAKRDLLLKGTVKLLEDTEKTGLYFSRVVVAEVNVTAYIYETLSVKGKLENIDASLDKIKIVVLDLKKQKIKRGTIIVNTTGNCTFSPEEQKI